VVVLSFESRRDASFPRGAASLGATTVLRLAGGAFLCYLGVKIFMARPARQPTTVTTSGFLRGFTSTFFSTATEP